MGRRLLMLVPAIAIVLSAAGPAAADEPLASTHGAILTLTRQLFDALADGRSEFWARTLADDAVVIDEFRRRQTRADVVKDIRPLPRGFSRSIEIRDPHVRQDRNTVEIDCENYDQETVRGQKFVVRYKSTLTFVRQGRDWKLVSLRTVTVPTAPPTLPVATVRLDDYPGTYRWGPDRAHTVRIANGQLVFVTEAGAPANALDPIARDVFIDAGDEHNLYVFRRDGDGRVTEVIERGIITDLRMTREVQ